MELGDVAAGGAAAIEVVADEPSEMVTFEPSSADVGAGAGTCTCACTGRDVVDAEVET